MQECPVSSFIERVKDLPGMDVCKGYVFLSVFKLLDSEEKKTLFSLLGSNISVHRVEKRQVEKVLLLGVVTEEGGYYVLSDRVRTDFMAACTRPVEENVLVHVERPQKASSVGLPRSQYAVPADGEAQQAGAKSREREGSSEVYSNMLYRTISNKPDGNKAVRRLMLSTGIISREGLTHKGFNFLLTGRKHQMWSLIVAHISENRSDPEREVLTLCELLAKDPKREYALDASQKSSMLELFESLGLLVMGQSTVRLSSSFRLLFDDVEGGRKFLALESNFRMYIYSNSPLDVFIISLFSVKCREFPNMIVGMINEDSIRQALAYGITAGQIRVYLTKNCKYEINENVLEQIRLWEKRMNRIESWESYLFSNFLNYKDFLLVESHCSNRNIRHRSYREKRVLVVDVESYDAVKEFIKTNIK
ncbi:transcription initiation factor TFIIH subunit 4 [Nematocida major]|uniref:transcription initiation factor TFIIH subunit 4 n=1 Tax=Nematocida major TaxID=1912982 RepID=UPI002007AD26|nr:transcription initiation factor TFIIH subunit 4 [Nematocida major]KAH9385209.1 transcription initiation factor TFIIH subunit 4 [Nematocida major]